MLVFLRIQLTPAVPTRHDATVEWKALSTAKSVKTQSHQGAVGPRIVHHNSWRSVRFDSIRYNLAEADKIQASNVTRTGWVFMKISSRPPSLSRLFRLAFLFSRGLV